MRKFLRITVRILLIITAVNVALLLAVQFFLNSDYARRKLDLLLSETVDGKVEYSGLEISAFKSFPRIKVKADSLRITYPHGKFSEYDIGRSGNVLFNTGKGKVSDTLAAVDKFSADINIWNLLYGTVTVNGIRVSGVDLYIHSYRDGHSNLDVFGTGGEREKKEKKDTADAVSLPWISLGELDVNNVRSIVFTSTESSLAGQLKAGDIKAEGKVKFNGDEVKIRGAKAGINSLHLLGYVNGYRLKYDLDHLTVDEEFFGKYNLDLASKARLDIPGTGRFDIPLNADARIGFRYRNNACELKIPDFNGNFAYIPLKVNGSLTLGNEEMPVNARLEIKGIPIETIAHKYGTAFVKGIDELQTDGKIEITVEAKGVLDNGKNSLPSVTAGIRIPETRIVCAPWKADGNITLDITGSLDTKKHARVDIRKLESKVPGLTVNLEAILDDLLGKDPSISLNTKALLETDNVIRATGLDSIMNASGNVNLNLEAFARKSDFDSMAFKNASVSGEILCNNLLWDMPGDSISVSVFRPEIRFSSSPEGMKITADLDSAGMRMGSAMSARVREMKNRAEIFKVEHLGVLVPKIEFEHKDRNLFFRYGDNRVFMQSINAVAAIQKRVKRVFGDRQEVRRFIETHKRAGDIDIALDSSYAQYLEAWKPEISVNVERGMAVTPFFPLRMRLRSFGLDFDGDKLTLDRFAAKVGSTDITIAGYLKGLEKALRKKGYISGKIDIHSNKANVNEVLAAINAGQEMPKDIKVTSETDESFVIDTLVDAALQMVELDKFLLPSNLSLEANVSADSVKVGPIFIGPVSSKVTMKRRTLQLMYTEASSDRGDMEFSGFFSTPSFKDISLGADVKLKNVSAERIINVIPGIDTIAPVLKSFKGRFACEAAATADMDQDMKLVTPSINGMMRISGENLSISDLGKFKAITGLLMFKDKNIGDIGNLYVNGIIHNNKLEIFPFILDVDRYELALTGIQGFDETMDYHASIIKSPLMMRFGINVTGTVDKPKVKLGSARYKNSDIPVFTTELDTLQINIANSIRDIYKQGAQRLVDYTRRSGDSLAVKKRTIDRSSLASDMGLSIQELNKIDSLRMQYSLDDESEALRKEVDSILNDTAPPAVIAGPQYEAVKSKGFLERIADTFKGGKKKDDSAENPRNR